MCLKKLTFVTIALFCIQSSFSQRNYDQYNLLGLTAGYSLFNINTSDLTTSQGDGFLGGFTTRGAFRNNFDLIYGLNFFSNKVGISAKNPNSGLTPEEIDFKLQGVQLLFLGSYNIIRHHLSIEAGPILNVSGKMKPNSSSQEEYIIDGYDTIIAKDLEDVSPVNFLVMVGLSTGIENFRASFQYQYGVTNIFNKLNKQDLEYLDFKGNSSTLLFSLIAYF